MGDNYQQKKEENKYISSMHESAEKKANVDARESERE